MKHLIVLLLPPICSGIPCSIAAAGSMELHSTSMKKHKSTYQLYEEEEEEKNNEIEPKSSRNF